jgi:predicted TIM-barrel fold metal-dependent hydrolase
VFPCHDALTDPLYNRPASQSVAETNVIDVNASLGEWPFGSLRHSAPRQLLMWLKTAGIERACVGPLEAPFYNDVQQANAKLHKTVGRYRDRLLPFCAIDPSYPDWQADLQQCRGQWHTAGVRLFPSYHGYQLRDACCAELFEVLQQHRLPVQIAPVISDPRMHHPRAHVPAASLEGLPDLLRRFPALNVALLNVRVETEPALKDAAAVRDLPNFFFDIAWVDGVGQVGRLVDEFGDEHILLGTNAPLMIPLSAVYKLRETDLSQAQIDRITRDNAIRFLGTGGQAARGTRSERAPETEA